MKILLINPPFFEEKYFLGKYKGLTPILNIIQPLGLAYIAAALEKKGLPVKIIDCSMGISSKQLLRLILAEYPEIIGIASTTIDFSAVKSIVQNIKSLLPKALLIIGGAHVTALPEETLRKSCFDIGVLGEAEETVVELMHHIETQGMQNLETIRGIVFKDDKEIINTGRREFIADLDRLPFPARHLLPPLEKYHPTPASYRRLPLAHLMSGRGCPCRCTFCGQAVFGKTVRLRSADNVLDEVEELILKYGAREIRFFDDIFTVDEERIYKICEGFHKRKINIPWTCLTGVDFVTKDLLKTMKSAGCWQILYGLESADPHMLKLLKKGNSLEQNVRAIKWARETGLRVRADFIVGTPGETLESMKKTLKFALNMKIDYAQFNPFFPFPGTEIYSQLLETGYKFNFEQPCSDLDYSRSLYLPEGISQSEYKRFLDYAYRKFYLRPKYLLNRLRSIKTRDEFKGQFNGFLAILKTFCYNRR